MANKQTNWFDSEGKARMINGVIMGIFIIIGLVSSILALAIGNFVICIVDIIFIAAFSITAAVFNTKSISFLGFLGILLIIIGMVGDMSWQFALLSMSVFMPIIIYNIIAIIHFFFYAEEHKEDDDWKKGGIKMAEDLDNSIEEYKNKNDELSKSYKRALEILKAKENVEKKNKKIK